MGVNVAKHSFASMFRFVKQTFQNRFLINWNSIRINVWQCVCRVGWMKFRFVLYLQKKNASVAVYTREFVDFGNFPITYPFDFARWALCSGMNDLRNDDRFRHAEKNFSIQCSFWDGIVLRIIFFLANMLSFCLGLDSPSSFQSFDILAQRVAYF